MASQSSLGLWQARINGEAPEEVRGRMVSGSFFQVLGANPVAGRVFTADADRVDTPEAVISHSFWQRRFGGRDDVIGRTLDHPQRHALDRRHHAAGVRRRDERPAAGLWVPLRLQPRVLPGDNFLHDTPPDKAMWLHVFGRLKPGVSRGRGRSAGERRDAGQPRRLLRRRRDRRAPRRVPLSAPADHRRVTRRLVQALGAGQVADGAARGRRHRCC